jgi:hypothetical protein
MRDVITNPTQVKTGRELIDRSRGRAHTAAVLFSQPELGIRHMTHVGLPGREAVELLLAARAEGLRATACRGAHGQVTVTLAPPPAPRVPEEPGEEHSAWLSRARSAWQTLCDRGRQLAHRVRSEIA